MAKLGFSHCPIFILAICLCGLSQAQVIELHISVLILGDSITQNGTYVSFISYFLQKRNPNFNYDIISIGLGSETAAGTSEYDHPFPALAYTLDSDDALAQVKPEIVFACYGMNDGIYHPLSYRADSRLPKRHRKPNQKGCGCRRSNHPDNLHYSMHQPKKRLAPADLATTATSLHTKTTTTF